MATRILSGESVLPANVEFVDSNALGGENTFGACDSENSGNIYLNRSMICNPDLLTAVFTEELDHHLDNVLGSVDAAED